MATAITTSRATITASILCLICNLPILAAGDPPATAPAATSPVLSGGRRPPTKTAAGSFSTTRPASTWADVHSFCYQLQKIDLAAIGRSKFEVVVIDYSIDGSGPGAFSAKQIRALQHSPAGPKKVLAYLSIGEAEDYRFYWNNAWDPAHTGRPAAGAPGWLGPQNPEWRGNYEVHYWDPAWQAVIFSYLDQILAAGYDGIYMDIIDGYEFWGPDGDSHLNRPSAQRDMVDFVLALAARARRTKPEFALFPQNGQLLAHYPDYLQATTGIGREDTWYNGNKRNKPSETNEVLADLDLFHAAGKPVLCIDYVTRPNLIDDFYAKALAKGYIPYATVRALDKLTINKRHDPE